jgi:hypothetical protein
VGGIKEIKISSKLRTFLVAKHKTTNLNKLRGDEKLQELLFTTYCKKFEGFRDFSVTPGNDGIIPFLDDFFLQVFSN